MKLKFQKQLYLIIMSATFACFGFYSCGPVIAHYDPIALQNAVSLKEKSLSLIAKAADPYQQHLDEIQALNTQLSQAYQYASNSAQNQLAAKEWDIIINPDGYLLGGFLTLWQQYQHLSPHFIEQAKDSISQAFDQLIILESGKPNSPQSTDSYPQGE